MKQLLILLILFIGSSSYFQLYSQDEWRDSLEVARKAYKNKEYDKALKYYKSAQKNAPEDVDLSDEIGQSAYRSRDFETAEKVYQQSNATKKKSQKKADGMHNLGNSRMKKKDYKGAVEAYKDALRNNPDDEETRYNLSEAIRKMNEKNNQKQNTQKDKKDEQNKEDQNKDQNKKKGDQNKNQNNDQKDGKDNKQNKDQKGGDKKQNNNSGKGGKQADIPDRTVEKMLDELMKKEAETKRRMSGIKGGQGDPQSGKDW